MEMTYATSNENALIMEKAIKCANLIIGVNIKYTKSNPNNVTTFLKLETEKPYNFIMLGKFLKILEE